jgi:hypothetical protein
LPVRDVGHVRSYLPGHVQLYADTRRLRARLEPDTDGHRRDHTHLGGDDFAEHLHLTENPDPLIAQLRAAHTGGYRWLHLTVTTDTYALGLSRGLPHQP